MTGEVTDQECLWGTVRCQTACPHRSGPVGSHTLDNNQTNGIRDIQSEDIFEDV